MELPDEIAARRAGVGEPAVLVGEFRRAAVLVPLLDDGLMSAEYGGIRWIYAFTGEASLSRFLQGLAPAAAPATPADPVDPAAPSGPGAPAVPGDYVSVLGARLLDSVIPSLDGPTGVAIDVADRDASMLLPPARGIVPDSCALDTDPPERTLPTPTPRGDPVE
ncbi:hypothetical protein LHJ74_04005 [Streptomyces sp. N2-109]|uniref:SseB protein N-terminal domain-containing protein n=1 Tax=Streptomyces gossypii TaxID=2883101 RepID=A0ABT2JMK2_9ACTN|nr:hypothetical protein [Streptomyces gossypii]MCT2589107.1 hypothetical protein [Streptomyces gossypii]